MLEADASLLVYYSVRLRVMRRLHPLRVTHHIKYHFRTTIFRSCGVVDKRILSSQLCFKPQTIDLC
jgi:hypothetical protein